ncbi:MAG: DUF2993 domain-containing protein [Pleurocapsa sp. MO_192.B19]|nr:DUF2993 domain-containing protein [Pleurocapsa sp. MO_192.B19]
MINKLISTGVKLYLRSLVTQVEDLQVTIVGKNRQILQGYIPQVLLSCDRTVYQGLFLQQVKVNGTNIGFNLPEVLKKKPLKLVEPIVVDIKLGLNAADLQASLSSPLLQSGLADLWQIILSAEKIDSTPTELANVTVEWHTIELDDGELNLKGTYQNAGDRVGQINLSTGVGLANSHTLYLSPLKILSQSIIVADLVEELEIDLGTDVTIEQLVIESEQMICSGKITVR